MNLRLKLTSLAVIITLSSHGQDIENNDTLRVLCEGPIFTLCEKMPNLKNGTSAFADTLKQYLQSRNEFPIHGEISLILAILRTGEVKYVRVQQGEVDKPDILIKALKYLSNQWLPGVQNGHLVCCYRRIKIEFLEDKIEITIPGRH